MDYDPKHHNRRRGEIDNIYSSQDGSSPVLSTGFSSFLATDYSTFDGTASVPTTAVPLFDSTETTFDFTQAGADVFWPQFEFPNELRGTHGTDLFYPHDMTMAMEWLDTPSMREATGSESVCPESADSSVGPQKSGTGRQEVSTREPWTPEQNMFLLESRKKGYNYNTIAEKMRKKFPMMGKITENRLAKRMQKLQEQSLDPLAQAVRNAMPRCIAEIEAEIQKIESTVGSKINEEMRSQVMSGLSKQFTTLTQNKITSWRKTRLNTPVTNSTYQ